jgi:hypothetical protein
MQLASLIPSLLASAWRMAWLVFLLMRLGFLAGDSQRRRAFHLGS